jgi:hypothetical protein
MDETLYTPKRGHISHKLQHNMTTSPLLRTETPRKNANNPMLC